MEQLNKIVGIRKYPKWFSEEEISLILKQILTCEDYWKKKGYADWGKFFRFRDFTLISTIYILALRPNEACCLKFTDFDWKHSILRIRGETNKTKKDSPPIPVPKLLLEIYKEYFKFPHRRFWRGSKYLFPSFENDHISSGRLKTIMREKILKPLDLWELPDGAIGKLRTTYRLRHSRARHIRNNQMRNYGMVDIFAIANIMRHADIRSTMVYNTDGDEIDDEGMKYLREQVEIPIQKVYPVIGRKPSYVVI